MDNDELIDRFNALTAQNIALMQIVAAVVNQTGIDAHAEYVARCAIFKVVTEPGMDADARAIQREVFSKVGRTVFGDRVAVPHE